MQASPQRNIPLIPRAWFGAACCCLLTAAASQEPLPTNALLFEARPPAAATNDPANLPPAPAGPLTNQPPAARAGVAGPTAPALASPEEPTFIDPALRESAAILSTTNLSAAKYADKAFQRQEAFRLQLLAARELRRSKSLDRARDKLLAVLDDPDAPSDAQRSAMLELALIAQEQHLPLRALQVYAQFLGSFPEDPGVPEVLLRQGLLFREMGAHAAAVNKFFAVLSSALNVKAEQLEYYQRLVLQAQAEIADTYFLQGNHEEAAQNYTRLLKLENPALNRAQIRFKLLYCLANREQHDAVVAEAEVFLKAHPGQPEEPEVRYLLATSLKRLGRNPQAMEQVLRLLESQQGVARGEDWLRWQQRTGNDIANQLYREGDYQSALQIYQQLTALDPTPGWQLPVQYQVGLALERLRQPTKAAAIYDQILAREAELGNAATPALSTLMDMARYRKQFVSWQTNAEMASRLLNLAPALAPTNGVTSLQ